MGARRDPDQSGLAVFAAELRAQREQAGLGREELAGRLNYSASLISMIESGHRSPSRDFAGRCDEAFGTPGTFARLEQRLRDVPFSSGFRPFQPYEAQAVALRLFEHSLIPGLLQTEAYARAVLETHPNTSQDVIEERVAARMTRQQILDRTGSPAYLEASSPRTRDLYLAHGYVLRPGAPFHLPGSGPPMWPMWRDPSARCPGVASDPRERPADAPAAGERM